MDEPELDIGRIHMDNKNVVLYFNEPRCSELGVDYYAAVNTEQTTHVCTLLSVAMELAGENRERCIEFAIRCLQARHLKPQLKRSDVGPGWFVPVFANKGCT